MAVHACLKNEFTEDEKYHNLMRWLKYAYLSGDSSEPLDYQLFSVKKF